MCIAHCNTAILRYWYCTYRRERPSLLDLLSEFGLISDGWLGSISPLGDWANALECWRSPSLRLVIPGIAVLPGVTHSDSHHLWYEHCRKTPTTTRIKTTQKTAYYLHAVDAALKYANYASRWPMHTKFNICTTQIFWWEFYCTAGGILRWMFEVLQQKSRSICFVLVEGVGGGEWTINNICSVSSTIYNNWNQGIFFFRPQQKLISTSIQYQFNKVGN